MYINQCGNFKFNRINFNKLGVLTFNTKCYKLRMKIVISNSLMNNFPNTYASFEMSITTIERSISSFSKLSITTLLILQILIFNELQTN